MLTWMPPIASADFNLHILGENPVSSVSQFGRWGRLIHWHEIFSLSLKSPVFSWCVEPIDFDYSAHHHSSSDVCVSQQPWLNISHSVLCLRSSDSEGAFETPESTTPVKAAPPTDLQIQQQASDDKDTVGSKYSLLWRNCSSVQHLNR